MSRIALAFLTRDKTELSNVSIKPLLGLPDVEIFWVDGSQTPAGRELPVHISLSQGERHGIRMHHDVVGGPDAAVCYALTTMLKGNYDYVGLCESDVVLPTGWFVPTMALFDRGRSEGLEVGAVSTRAYEDRILIQRDGYAVVHNLGWGMQIMTREAARITLTRMRTSITTENRRVFCQIAGIDIGRYWAFRALEHSLCPDWGNDRTLAAHGLASLALTPSPVEMIGQNPPLAEQGLRIADAPVELLRNDATFRIYASNLASLRQGVRAIPNCFELYDPSTGTFTIFPHQVATFGGVYEGDWRLKWTQGFGPFSWKAGMMAHDTFPTLTIPLSGSVEFLVSGGEHGGTVQLEDTHSGYQITPPLPPEPQGGGFMSLPVPAGVSYRQVKLTMLSPGTVFYGIRTREPQPWISDVEFDWHTLPRV